MYISCENCLIFTKKLCQSIPRHFSNKNLCLTQNEQFWQYHVLEHFGVSPTHFVSHLTWEKLYKFINSVSDDVSIHPDQSKLVDNILKNSSM